MNLRRLLITTLVVLTTLQPTALAAQMEAEAPSQPIWRRVVLGTLGAAIVGGGAAFGANEQEGSLCGSKACIVSVATIIGASAGYFIGREGDLEEYRHSVEGPSMDFGLRTVDLDETPTGMVGKADGILTLSRSRIGMIDEDLRFRPLLNGVRARSAAIIPDDDYLLVASNTAILGLPIPMSEMGADSAEASTLFDEGATTLELLSGETVAVGSPGRIRRLSLSQPGRARTAGEVESRGLPMGLKVANGALWSVEDSLVVARDPESLRELGEVDLPGRARTLSVSGRSGVVTMGADGAALLNLSDSSSPSVMAMVRGMEFAYAGAVLDGRLYVAAGPQGIFVYDVTSPTEPRALGVARDVGFAGDLLVHGGRLYILDRERRQVHRADGLR